jgi:AraC-like DNA-binding protein
MSNLRHTPSDEPHFIVRSIRAATPHGGKSAAHRHSWHQLIYAERGTLTVETDAGVWSIPTGWAVWAAAKTPHAITFHKGCAYTALYFRPSRRATGPSRAVPVSPLLAALIERIGKTGMLDRREIVHRALAQMTAIEIPSSAPAALTLPLPRSTDLRVLAAQIIDGPDARGDARALAHSIGLSGRTLERRFADETGMSLGSWRRHARLLASVRLTGEGKTVAAVAAATGYRSASAFIAAYRAMFGTTPGRPLTNLTQTHP